MDSVHTCHREIATAGHDDCIDITAAVRGAMEELGSGDPSSS